MLRMPIRSGRFACFLSAILLLTLLPGSSAYALSAACSALNMINPATFSRSYAASAFEAGESVHITLTDNGLDPKTNQTNSDSVIMRSSSFALYSEYRTFTGSAGTYTLDASASQITSTGLFLAVNNNNSYINDIIISCSAAATVSSDATLSNLSLSEGTLTPGFSSGITSYSTRVANGVTSITVTPTTSNLAAHVRVNGNSLNSGSGYSVPLVVGTNSINVVVTAEDGTSSANYLVQVERLEPTPIAGSSSLNVAFNSINNPINLPITGGTPNSLTISTSPAHGTLSVVDVSHVTYTPAANYVGNDSFTYISSNSAGSSATGTMSVTVSPPTLAIAPGSLPAATLNTPYSQTFNASGGSGNYSFSMSGLSPGLTLSPAGVLSGMPAIAGNFSFSVIVTDTITNSSAHQSYTLNVALAGQPPVANTVTSNVVANSGENSIELLMSGGAATTINILQQPLHGSARVLNSRILYKPVAGFSGSDSLIYSASNSFGTTQATVTLNVTAAVLSFTPAAGALPQAVVGNAYAQNFSATGGVAPYSYRIQGAIPAGMVFTNGGLSGTPDTVSDAAFTLIATDANGATGQAVYTLKVSAAQPVGVDHTTSVVAGGAVRVSLTENARGGPFSAARLLAQPDSALGSASISGSDNDYQLVFQAAPQASGSVALRYVLFNGSTPSAAATVTITIAGRPNPAQNPDVIGMISAQLQSAQNFARAQISNFNDRLERLHDDASARSDMNGIRFNMPTSKTEHGVRDDAVWNNAWERNGRLPALPQLAGKSSDAQSHANAPTRINTWTGGYVDFGHAREGGVSFSHTLVGVSTGADYRFTPSFTAGMGMGFGRDVSDVGNNGSRSNGRSISSAIYASYHPAEWFIDGLLGYSRLDYDGRRYVGDTEGMARSSRGGYQMFGAVTSGYDYRLAALLISPYARAQLSRTWLDAYTEQNAGIYNLAFAAQTLSQFTGTAGLRTQYAVPLTWSTLRWQSRLEYAQTFSDQGRARVGYADVGNDSWTMDLTSESRENLVLGMGLDFLLPHAITPGIAYQGTLGLDGAGSRSQMIMIRVNIGF